MNGMDGQLRDLLAAAAGEPPHRISAEAVPDGPAAGDLAAEVTARIAVCGALGVLSDRQRAVLVLRIFDDLSEAQVARVLGCAIGTVKSTMARAVAQLREDPRLAELMEREAR